ncbi:hypothetical protein [Massilia aquatica]|uniref:Uncharacterized protein n=1 Tax=Massilia aquatica TaxID=2609000 RepID=A0ABX0MLI3_9BURK|nr:hypothetical protein [Massilia aquatica]NHZ44389.1 hypothetical protein [Massilia aquatica]
MKLRAPEGGLPGAGRVRMVRVRGVVFFVVLPAMLTALIVVVMGCTLAPEYDRLMTNIAALRRAPIDPAHARLPRYGKSKRIFQSI